MKRQLSFIGVIGVALGIAHVAAGQQGAPNEGRPQPGPRLKIERDLEYGRADGRPLTLDIYRPDPLNTPTPVVVWIHGTNGGDATKATTPAGALVTPGYAVASIDYRSANRHARSRRQDRCPVAACERVTLQYRSGEDRRLRLRLGGDRG
jgi:acetyl esterase/lipase